MSLLAGTQPALGIDFNQVSVRMFNRSGATLSKGMVAQLNISASATETVALDNNIGKSSSQFANVINANSSGPGSTIFAIALEDVEDDKSGKFCVQGICSALMWEGETGQTLSVPFAVGQRLFVASTTGGDIAEAQNRLTNGAFSATPAEGGTVGSGARSVALLLNTEGNTYGELMTVLFDGVQGFGQ